MSSKKSNIDFLRQILDKYLKQYDEGAYSESIEFLEAIAEEMDEFKKEIDHAEDENDKLEIRITELKSEIEDLESDNKEFTIQAGIGAIGWSADNIQLRGLMQVLGDKIKSHTPLKIENILTAL